MIGMRVRYLAISTAALMAMAASEFSARADGAAPATSAAPATPPPTGSPDALSMQGGYEPPAGTASTSRRRRASSALR